ncbi:MAG: hypothetical protein R6U11_10845 [Bacteroidales bacterium]
MKTIRNMRELQLVKQKLEYQEKLCEKEMAASTADIVDNMADKLKDVAFDLGTRLILRFFKLGRNHDKCEE